MSTTINAVAGVIRSQLGGYFPGNSPYGEWYAQQVNNAVYRSGQFCAMGLSWSFAQVGGLDIFPLHAYTPSGVAWWKKAGRWHNGTAGIKAGDVVYFDFPGLPNRVSHVGWVESVNTDGSINTLEYNTSSVVGGDQRNGRTVARKRRSSSIVGYGRPAYSTGRAAKVTIGTTLAAIAAAVGVSLASVQGVNPGVAPTATLTPGTVIQVPEQAVIEPSDPVTPVAPPPYVAPAPQQPATSGAVADQQRALNRLGYGLAVDGIKGPLTKAAIRSVQARCGIVVDGSYGPITTACVNRLIAGTATSNVLRRGDHGAAVGTVQAQLNRVGARLAVDNSYGPLTTAAVRNFQARAGLVVDGVTGPKTKAALNSLATGTVHAVSYGDRGHDVELVQARVGVQIDGSFGPKTLTAVLRFQRAHGLARDGIVGPVTSRALGLGYRG